MINNRAQAPVQEAFAVVNRNDATEARRIQPAHHSKPIVRDEKHRSTAAEDQEARWGWQITGLLGGGFAAASGIGADPQLSNVRLWPLREKNVEVAADLGLSGLYLQQREARFSEQIHEFVARGVLGRHSPTRHHSSLYGDLRQSHGRKTSGRGLHLCLQHFPVQRCAHLGLIH